METNELDETFSYKNMLAKVFGIDFVLTCYDSHKDVEINVNNHYPPFGLITDVHRRPTNCSTCPHDWSTSSVTNAVRSPDTT